MKIRPSLTLFTLAVVSLASSGCARWTLWPKSDLPTTEPAAQAQATGSRGSGSLMDAVGLGRSSDDAPAMAEKLRQQQEQQFAKDMMQLDPALAMARLTERQGDPAEARRQYRRYIDKNPSHPLPYHRLGVMAAREAKYQEAEFQMKKAAQLAPPSAELLSDLGYLYYLLDRLDEAEPLLRQAAEMEPSNTNATNNLAIVLAAKGNFDNSLRHFRRVNEEAQARANLAYAHAQHGNLEESREEYLRALTLDNSLTAAAKALLQVEEARKREQAALAEYQQAMGDELIAGPAESTASAVQTVPMPRRQPAQAQPMAAQHGAMPSQRRPQPMAPRQAQSTMHQQTAQQLAPPPARRAQAMPIQQAAATGTVAPPPMREAAAEPTPNRPATHHPQASRGMLMPIPDAGSNFSAFTQTSSTAQRWGQTQQPDSAVQPAGHVEAADDVQASATGLQTPDFVDQSPSSVQSASHTSQPGAAGGWPRITQDAEVGVNASKANSGDRTDVFELLSRRMEPSRTQPAASSPGGSDGGAKFSLSDSAPDSTQDGRDATSVNDSETGSGGVSISLGD